MKRIYLFVLAATVGVAGFAQESQPQLRTPMAVKTRFGLRGGLNLAKIHLEETPGSTGLTKTQSKTSFNAGILLNVPIAGMFRFQPEVSVSSQGAKLEGSNGTSLGEQDLHYINVPLNFQLQTPGGFFVQTGPQVGYLIEAKRKDVPGSTASHVDNKDAFDKMDFAWSAGVGYLARFGLGIDARYNYGLANIVEDNSTAALGKMRNRVAQISLVYHFNAFK
jgi:hypothetical protein